MITKPDTDLLDPEKMREAIEHAREVCTIRFPGKPLSPAVLIEQDLRDDLLELNRRMLAAKVAWMNAQSLTTWLHFEHTTDRDRLIENGIESIAESERLLHEAFADLEREK